MGIPDYQTIMLPLLEFAGDQKEHSLREAIEGLADEFELTDEERKHLLPSGRQRHLTIALAGRGPTSRRRDYYVHRVGGTSK